MKDLEKYNAVLLSIVCSTLLNKVNKDLKCLNLQIHTQGTYTKQPAGDGISNEVVLIN